MTNETNVESPSNTEGNVDTLVEPIQNDDDTPATDGEVEDTPVDTSEETPEDTPEATASASDNGVAGTDNGSIVEPTETTSTDSDKKDTPSIPEPVSSTQAIPTDTGFIDDSTDNGTVETNKGQVQADTTGDDQGSSAHSPPVTEENKINSPEDEAASTNNSSSADGSEDTGMTPTTKEVATSTPQVKPNEPASSTVADTRDSNKLNTETDASNTPPNSDDNTTPIVKPTRTAKRQPSTASTVMGGSVASGSRDDTEETELIDGTNRGLVQAVDNTGNNHNNHKRTVLFPLWTQVTQVLHTANQKFVSTLAMVAARNPVVCIGTIIVLSVALMTAGLTTNFQVNVNEKELYAPFNSVSRQHYNWYLQESGLKEDTRPAILMIHNHGANVLNAFTMAKTFEALDTVRNTTGYNDICNDGAYWDSYKEEFTCRIVSATRFWYHDKALFESQVQSDDDLIQQLSASEYPGGAPIGQEYSMGNPKRDENGTITFVPSFFVYIMLSDKELETLEFEAAVLEKLATLQAQWDEDDSINLRLDYYAERSAPDEFRRAIDEDLYLLGVGFFIMSGFACFVFYKRQAVQSRCLLGVGSVVTIVLSLCSGFGIIFCCGIPFTSLTQLLPFVVFGIGLDDTFIITGAFLRSDASLSPEERIQEAITEVGSSISATTITTASAFLLGLTSSIPAIYWLCLYAFPTIIIDFLYQITFFVAILTLDERRVQASRMDVISCCKGSSYNDDELMENDPEKVGLQGDEDEDHQAIHFADTVMAWYAHYLLHPGMKVLVLGLFSTFFGYCLGRAAMMEQNFDVKTMFPNDSYVVHALDAVNNFQERSYAFHIFFRNEDQSDPSVQQQMISFVEDIQALPALGSPPPLCWVRDLQALHKTEYFDVIKDLPLEEQIQVAMEIPAFKEAYGNDIVIDGATGKISASKCTILARNSFLLDDVDNRVGYLNEQHAITMAQPINHGKTGGEESFFTFQDIYLNWEFYNVAISELVMNSLLGMAAVSVVTLIFMPHWTAAFFIIPIVAVVYIDLLGVMQMAGLDINAVTFVCLIISIGLIVDFLFHIMLRYVESTCTTRDGKVKETLRTMGSSILLGGLSTFLGILPLAFSTSMIMRTIFTSLCSMIILAVTHGLVVLPVVLSLMGPISNKSVQSLDAHGNLVVEMTREGCLSPMSDDSFASHVMIQNSKLRGKGKKQRMSSRTLLFSDMESGSMQLDAYEGHDLTKQFMRSKVDPSSELFVGIPTISEC